MESRTEVGPRVLQGAAEREDSPPLHKIQTLQRFHAAPLGHCVPPEWTTVQQVTEVRGRRVSFRNRM
jgi:hypothetical protein